MPSTGAERLSEFRVFETEEFKKALVRSGSTSLSGEKLETYVYPQLRQWPYFGPKYPQVAGYAPETWRYRIGPYRYLLLRDEDERIVFHADYRRSQRRIQMIGRRTRRSLFAVRNGLLKGECRPLARMIERLAG